MAKISIIVPIYNVEKYLPKCIESILAQTYKDFELILVDDGSPDNSPQICDEYAKKDDRVIVIHKPNGGVSSARNAGLDRATGQYIGFVDPDDYITSDMYTFMIDGMKKSGANMAICGYDYINENGKVERPYNVRENELLTQKQFMSMQFDMPPTIRHVVWNKVFKADIFNGTRFPEGLHSSEDVYVLIECAKRLTKAVFIHQPLYKNLVRSGSATHGGLKIEEPAADLSLAMAIASSYKAIPIPAGDILIGELGLTGEVRRVARIEERVKEAKKLGFTRAIIPERNLKGSKFPKGIEVIGVKTIDEAIRKCLVQDKMPF